MIGCGSCLIEEERENVIGKGMKRGFGRGNNRGGRNRERGGVRGICRGDGRGVSRGSVRGLSRVSNNRNIRGPVREGSRMKKTQSNVGGSCIEDILRRGEEIMKEDAAEFDANVGFSSGVDGRRGVTTL